jgi:mannose-1-phosphate guanylyltransferase/mannose-6-phosphate isomerase
MASRLSRHPKRAILVMAGGHGTRLWPLSRRDRPKQFLSLVTDKTLIEDALARVEALVDPSRVYVIAEEEILLSARPLLRGVPLANFIAEPAARNTWPCCVLGTTVIAERLGPKATVLVLPADHAVRDVAAFREALERGFEVAEAGEVVTFGIKPDRAETGYGYIKCGAVVDGGEPRVREGLSFKEKPDEETAAHYLRSDDYLWNSGMFVWRADRFSELCADNLADQYDFVRRMKKPVAAGDTAKLAGLYAGLDATSVDYAFMERLPRFTVVETACGWDDIGSFDALERVLTHDNHGNIRRGEVYALGGVGNIVLAAGGRPVVMLGVDNNVIVDAGDVILVYPKGAGQDVRLAVEMIAARKPDLT